MSTKMLAVCAVILHCPCLVICSSWSIKQTDLIFHDFQGLTTTFHDFPGLEMKILKFHDFPGFPWPVRTLENPANEVVLKLPQLYDMEAGHALIDGRLWFTTGKPGGRGQFPRIWCWSIVFSQVYKWLGRLDFITSVFFLHLTKSSLLKRNT